MDAETGIYEGTLYRWTSFQGVFIKVSSEGYSTKTIYLNPREKNKEIEMKKIN